MSYVERWSLLTCIRDVPRYWRKIKGQKLVQVYFFIVYEIEVPARMCCLAISYRCMSGRKAPERLEQQTLSSLYAREADVVLLCF